MQLLLLSQSHRCCANAAAAAFVESPLRLPPPLLRSCCHRTTHTHTHTQIIRNLNNLIDYYFCHCRCCSVAAIVPLLQLCSRWPPLPLSVFNI
jgi:hypothetical protein